MSRHAAVHASPKPASLTALKAAVAAADLDRDRVGVFWALLFLSSQGAVELEQQTWLHGPLRLKRIPLPGTATQLPIASLQVPDPVPTSAGVAA